MKELKDINKPEKINYKILLPVIALCAILIFSLFYGFYKMKQRNDAVAAFKMSPQPAVSEIQTNQKPSDYTSKTNTTKDNISQTEPETTEKNTQKHTTNSNKVTQSTDNPLNGKDSPKAKAFYKTAVFVGDSLMNGFEAYVGYQGNDFLGSPHFLAATSFSAFNALRPVSEHSTHPLYKGKKQLIEDSISMMDDVDKVFIDFGINDIMNGVDFAVGQYKEIISRIVNKSPDKKIYIISATYMMKGSEKGKLTNPNIASFNKKMQAYCAEKGYGYVDIASHLGDPVNGIRPQYSSDHYVHVNNSGYAVWSSVLRNYAESL